MKFIIAKELLGAVIAVSGGLIAFFYGFYTVFGYCGFLFLWSMFSLFLCFFEKYRRNTRQIKSVTTSDSEYEFLAGIRTENQKIALNHVIKLRSKIDDLSVCENDTNSATTDINAIVYLKPDTNLCKN